MKENISLWSAGTELPRYEKLREDISCPVLIIGGGMAGLLCARFLTDAGLEPVLLEAGRLCSGTTKNSTAKITAQHGLIYHKLIKRFGTEAAQLYLEANQQALRRFEDLCRNIPCSFEIRDSFVYSLSDSELIHRELRALESLGYTPGFADRLPLPFPVAGALSFSRQAQFDPMAFAAGLLKGLRIFENSRVETVADGIAYTKEAKVRAEKIIVCSHFPFIDRHGAYFLKLYQHRSYVLALENAPSVGGMYVDEDEKGLSFRDAKGLLLLGGGSHRTGKKGGGWAELRRFAGKYYPEARVSYRWAAQDCMSLDSMPYIGRYFKGSHELYCATGFNKWGMSGSMAAAELLCDMVQERDNPYEMLFSPQRSILHPQLLVNGLESAKNYILPSKRHCSHMGCSLKWNAIEHSWDCPCHGSRFDKDGKVLDNPALDDLE